MAIKWSNIVGDKTVASGGYAGDLLKVTLAHIQEARDNNQITESDLGGIYTAAITGALNTATTFELEVEKIKLSKIPSVMN